MKKILISGSSGLIGSHLSVYLSENGYAIRRLVRQRDIKTGSKIFWDPLEKIIDPSSLDGFDVVIHLAAASIASWPWSHKKKLKIKNSRVHATHFLSKRLAKLDTKPRSLICASATGYYGDRGEEFLDEDSSAGRGFLSEVCQEWEAAVKPARQAGIRVANLRFGMVLSPENGILAKLLPVFKLGLGAVVGNGKQYLPWVSITDVSRIIKHVIEKSELQGPINVVTPSPVTQAELSKCLARVLNRPLLFTVPSFILKATMGQMAEDLLLTSIRAIPKKLIDSSYTFEHPELEPALRSLLRR